VSQLQNHLIFYFPQLFSLARSGLSFKNTVRIPSGLASVVNKNGEGVVNGNNVVLYLHVELGLYDNFYTVQQPTPLCQLNVVQVTMLNDASSDADPTECPHAGVYQWTAYYTVPAFSSDASLHYTPDARLVFATSTGQRVGCVVTGPIALRTMADRHAVAGLVALGTAIAVFLGLFAALLVLTHRRKERVRLLAQQQQYGGGTSNTSSSSRAQYFRTLANGQVVPVVSSAQHGWHPPVLPPRRLPTRPPLRQQLPEDRNDSVDDDDDDDSSADALNISNPAYNETQLPSRPII
jgi:hypothetical protein